VCVGERGTRKKGGGVKQINKEGKKEIRKSVVLRETLVGRKQRGRQPEIKEKNTTQ